MTLPAIFQRYTSATTRDTLDMEGATSLRDSIGRGVGGLKLISLVSVCRITFFSLWAAF
jgi:hypothetical protein